MNIIFMRHGEAIDNVKEVLSSNVARCSTLTDRGLMQVTESVSMLENVDKIYSSPLIRTLQTAREVANKFSLEVNIDDRIREIDWGVFDGEKNNEFVDEVRERQSGGDYFVRFGKYGENKFDIESRLCDFLYSVRRDNFQNNTVVIVSHGTVISFMKRIMGLKSSHAKKGKFEEFINVDFSKLDAYMAILDNVRREEVKSRKKMSESVKNENIRAIYGDIAKEFNNMEFNNEVLGHLIEGTNENIADIRSGKVDKSSDLILISIFKNIEVFAEKWLSHYAEIGVKNFVLIDNNSSDRSVDIIKKCGDKYKINVDILSMKSDFNCFRACGARQAVMERYGVNKWFLIVDSDELFVFSDKGEDISEYIKNLNKGGALSVKAMMVDVYSKKPIFSDCDLSEFCYFDCYGYKKQSGKYYGERIFGGARSRVFGLKSSIQKIPLIYYTGKVGIVNDHFIYPVEISNVRVSSILLHYKFLPNTISDYRDMANSGVHWNNSKEYKRYVEAFVRNREISLYSSSVSKHIDELKLSELIS